MVHGKSHESYVCLMQFIFHLLHSGSNNKCPVSTTFRFGVNCCIYEYLEELRVTKRVTTLIVIKTLLLNSVHYILCYLTVSPCLYNELSL